MISLCKWLLGMPVPPDRHTKQSLTQANHTRWCINTIRSPDDERCDARNMQRHEINKYMKKRVKLVITMNLQRANLAIEWGNSPASYSEGAGFISRPRDLLFWHVFSGYSQASRQRDGYCMKLSHAACFHVFHSSLIINQPITRQCIDNLSSTSLCS